MNNTHLLPHSLMGTVTRTRLLMAAFCLSLCGLGLTAGYTTLAQVANVMSVIVDNRDPDFAPGDFVSSDYVPAYKGHTAYTAAKTVMVPAEWTLSTQGNATYNVYATWGYMRGVKRTEKATYVVKVDGTAKGEKTVNQNKAPVGLNMDGWNWELLATVTVTNGQEITVELGTAGDAITLADAVMIRKVTPAATTGGYQPPSFTCGNGQVEGGFPDGVEPCDDGNLTNGDGCSSTCNVEAGWSCRESLQGSNAGQSGGGAMGRPVPCYRIDNAMPTDMSTCLNNPAYYWDQESTSCIAQRTSCTDPDNGANPGSIGHTFGFRTQNAGPVDARIRTGGKDFCVSATKVREHSCTGTYFITMQDITCEGGTTCVNGACVNITIPPEDPCGNGVHDEGEQCDLGTPGKDTPIPGRPGYICKANCTVEVPKIFCRHNPTGNNLQCSSNFTNQDCAAQGGTAYKTMSECEFALVACRNGFDDDKDGTIDMADKGCATESDMNEGDGIADLGLGITADLPNVTKGATITLNSTLHNYGNDNHMAPIKYGIDIPAGITYDAPNSNALCVMDSGRLYCTIPSLKVGNTSMPLRFIVGETAPCGAISFVSRLTTPPQLQNDSNSSNNVATVSVNVTCPNAILLGDANNDGTITTGDPTRILQIVSAGTTPTPDELARGDVNKNGRITKADAYLVLGYLSGQLDSLPAKFGDVTGDMTVTATDASRVSQMITALARRDDGSLVASMLNMIAQLRVQDITARMRFLADVNRDGVINQLDVDLIMQAATGIHFELPVEATTTTCTDPDGGDKRDVASTATMVWNGVTTLGKDVCTTSYGNAYNHEEFYCDTDKTLKTTISLCPNGCENGACKATPVAQCTSPTGNGSVHQNQTLSVDVDQNGTVDIRDARLTIVAYNQFTANGTIPTSVMDNAVEPAVSVNVKPDVDGDGAVDVQDVLVVIHYLRCKQPRLTLTSANFSCASANFVTTATVAYEARNTNPLILMLENESWLYNGQGLTSAKQNESVTTFDNVRIPAGAKVKLCDSVNKTFCSNVIESQGTACQHSITTGTIEIAVENGVDVAKVKGFAWNFPTCLHAFKQNSRGIMLHKQNHFCDNKNVTFTVPLKATTANPNGGLEIKEGDTVELCHGNNSGICSAPVKITKGGTQPVACAIPTDLRKGAPHQYQPNPYDVNNDGGVTNADAQAVTNHLNTVGAGAVPSTTPPPFLDVNGDNSITAFDSLLIINYLNAGCGGYPVTPTACNPPAPKGVAYQNSINALDVDNNGFIYEADALTITNHLNTIGAGVPPSGTVAPPFTDVNGDGSVTAMDSLQLINRLNAGCPPAVTTGTTAELFVTLDSTPVRQRQLLAGTLSETVMRVELRAQNENVDVTMLRFVSVGGTASSIDRLELFKEGATTSFATASASACGQFSVTNYQGSPSQTFCSPLQNGQLVIQNGQSVDVLVKARMKSDEQGAISAEPIQLAIDTSGGGGGGGGMTGGGMGAQLAQTTTTFAFVEARSTPSNKTLYRENINIGTPTSTGRDTPIVGPKHVSVFSKIVTIANANPDADGTNVPTGVSPVGQFKFTAAPNVNTYNGPNKVVIQSMILRVTSTNVQYNNASFKLYNKADSTVKIPCTLLNTAASGNPVVTNAYVQCTSTPAFDFSIASGESQTYVLETNVTNAQVTGTAASSLRVSLENFADPNSGAGYVPWKDSDARANPPTFQWFEYADTVINSTAYGTAAGSTTAPLADNATCNTMPGYSIRNVGNVIAGTQFQATMVMDNPGPSTWVVGAATPYNLTILPETNWGLAAATHNSVIGQPAETQVKPGQVFSFDFYPLVAPSTPGTYPIKIQMKKNGVAFGSVCTHNIVVKAPTVAVTPVGDACPDVQTAKAQMPLFGSAGKFRQTTDGKFLVWAALEGGTSRYVKGVNFDTCVTTTYGTAEAVTTGIDEISVCANGTKIVYKDRNVSGNTNMSKLWLVDKATNTKTLVTDKAYSNGTGDRGLISPDCTKVVLTAWGANIDNDSSTTVTNTDGSRELFLIKNITNGSPVITQLTNFVGGTDQYTNLNDALCEDAACRFISVNLDWNPVTGKRHERDVLTTAPKPSDISIWQSRLYVVDTQTKTFHKISDASNVSNRSSFQSLIDAKIAAITGSSASTDGFLRTFFARLAGSVLDMADLAGSLLR